MSEFCAELTKRHRNCKILHILSSNIAHSLALMATIASVKAMHIVQNYNLSSTKQVYWCGKQGRTAMSLMILKWKNWLGKVQRTCSNFRAQNLQFFGAEF